jgi:hypothetical protein
MQCTRCDGTGFLNLEQVDGDILAKFTETGDHQIILDWIDEMAIKAMRAGGSCTCSIHPQWVPCSYCEVLHDVQICNCCSDGETWYGTPGEHDWNNSNDPKGCR